MEQEFKSFAQLEHDALTRKYYWMRPTPRDVFPSVPGLFGYGSLFIAALTSVFAFRGWPLKTTSGFFILFLFAIFALHVNDKLKSWRESPELKNLETFSGLMRRYAEEQFLEAAGEIQHPCNEWRRMYEDLSEQEKKVVDLLSSQKATRSPAMEAFWRTLQRDLETLEKEHSAYNLLRHGVINESLNDISRLAEYLEVLGNGVTAYGRNEKKRVEDELFACWNDTLKRLRAQTDKMNATARMIRASQQLVTSQKADA